MGWECHNKPRSRLEAEENLRLAAEKQEWDMMGEESQRREDAAKEKETAAKKKEQARLQMAQLEEVGYGDNFTSLEGTLPCIDRESERVTLRLGFRFPVFKV